MTSPSGVRRTQWNRDFADSLPGFLRTESGAAGLLVAAIAAAVVWVNAAPESYTAVWQTAISVRIGDVSFTRDLQSAVNSGLMTLFFLVVGLEARREYDLGQLRDRRQLILPCVTGLIGMAVPIGIYLAVNAGGEAAHGWGIVMSTDTALALGALSLVWADAPMQIRAFLVTVTVVDDIGSLILFVVAYSEGIDAGMLAVAGGIFALIIVGLMLRLDIPLMYVLLGVALWSALAKSGVDPVLTGLLIGLAAWAYSPSRGDLERASGLFRTFREQPTPEFAGSATSSMLAALSPNDRLQRVFRSWASYLIVPLFGLANGGIRISGEFLAHAYAAPITLGIIIGYVVGKPVAVLCASWAVSRLSRGQLRPAVGWAAMTGSGTIAGMGFTVSFLVAGVAFHGERLDQAKLGVLTASVIAVALTGGVARVTQALPQMRRARALYGESERLIDLIPPVDPDRDHILGPDDAPVTVVEYGDFECPHCAAVAEPAKELYARGHVRLVWRHLPLRDVHPEAELAAEAAEAAAKQSAFWQMHELLLHRQDRLRPADLIGYAAELGLDVDRFTAELERHEHAPRVVGDVESASLSGVSGTPTFFINGERQHGAYDLGTLGAAIEAARARAEARAAPTDSWRPWRPKEQ
jgi:Na+/H+ antiporter NhaA